MYAMTPKRLAELERSDIRIEEFMVVGVEIGDPSEPRSRRASHLLERQDPVARGPGALGESERFPRAGRPARSGHLWPRSPRSDDWPGSHVSRGCHRGPRQAVQPG